MIGGKQRTLPVRAFGAEPGIPDIPSLAAWVAERRGSQGDLASYLLDQSLGPQREAGVTVPCAGGKFYRSRILESILGLEGQAIIGEIGARPEGVTADTLGLAGTVRGISIAMPAPHLLGLTDQYYHDNDEVSLGMTGAYRSLMRTMRDCGCGGHVLLCDRIDEEEVRALARKKVFFFHPSPVREDLKTLLEYQRQVAVPKSALDSVFSLADEYDIAGLIILDPDEAALPSVLLREDPERVTVGGYCTADCPDYWKNLVTSAVYRV